MKKPLYKRELSHSYLVMEDIPEELAGHYQYRMILRNRIPGLLVSSERYMEGRACIMISAPDNPWSSSICLQGSE